MTHGLIASLVTMVTANLSYHSETRSFSRDFKILSEHHFGSHSLTSMVIPVLKDDSAVGYTYRTSQYFIKTWILLRVKGLSIITLSDRGNVRKYDFLGSISQWF